jgi:hypothetical protein
MVATTSFVDVDKAGREKYKARQNNQNPEIRLRRCSGLRSSPSGTMAIIGSYTLSDSLLYIYKGHIGIYSHLDLLSNLSIQSLSTSSSKSRNDTLETPIWHLGRLGHGSSYWSPQRHLRLGAKTIRHLPTWRRSWICGRWQRRGFSGMEPR